MKPSSLISPLRAAIAANRRRTTDVFVIGYPKTGNTWLRVLLGHYVRLVFDLDHLPLFDEYDRLGRCARFGAAPTIGFSHGPLSWEGQTVADLTAQTVVAPYGSGKVVLLSRYPLDAQVSLWMQQRFRTTDGYAGDLPSFLDNPVWGLEKFYRFHALWQAADCAASNFMVLRYEDMKVDAMANARRLIDFVGLPLAEDHLASAVELASFDRMKAMEQSAGQVRYPSSGLSIFATGDRANPDAHHVRSGAVGGYRQHLSAADTHHYESQVARLCPDFLGYGKAPSPHVS